MKKHIGNILRVVISIGIMAYLFHSIFQKEAAKYFADQKIDPATLPFLERFHTIWTQGPQAFAEIFRTANLFWLAVAVALFGVTFWFGVLRWQLLLNSQDIKIRLRRVAAICFVGQFFNSFLLGATGGDLIKSYYAARQTQTHKAEAVMSVVVDRIIGLIGLFAIAIVMMSFEWRWLYEHPKLHWPSLVVLTLILSICAAIPLSFWRGLPGKFEWLQRLKQRIPMRDQISRALDSYQSYARHKGVVGKAFLLSVGVHSTIFIGVICLGRGLHVGGVAADKYFLVLPMVNTIASIPITVSGFGVREGMYKLMFGELGVDGNVAVALGLLSYGAQFFWSLVGGLVYMLWKHEPHMLQHAKEDLEKETSA